MASISRELGSDIAQKSLFKAVEFSAKTYKDMTGKQLTKEQKDFLIEIVSGLTDAVITALRKGKLKPMDIAQQAVSQALSTTSLIKGDVAAAKYMDCGLALVALALTSVEMYGMAVTSAAAAVAITPETGGISLAADAGVIVIGVLYWNYIVLDTSMRCVEDFKTIENVIPKHYNVASKRQNYVNSANACYIR